jgi:hypothetical protein
VKSHSARVIARLGAEINHQAPFEGIKKGGALLRGHTGSPNGNAERLHMLEKCLDRSGEGVEIAQQSMLPDPISSLGFGRNWRSGQSQLSRMSFDLVQVIDIPFNREIKTPSLVDSSLPNSFCLIVFFGAQGRMS